MPVEAARIPLSKTFEMKCPFDAPVPEGLEVVVLIA